MSNSTVIDAHFMEMAAPLLSEFGFPNVKYLIKEQLCLMLQSKISHFSAESSLYESRCGGIFEVVSKQALSDGQENLSLTTFSMTGVLREKRRNSTAAN